MTIEIDHIFVNIDSDFPEKAKLPSLPIKNRRAHPGQGTTAEFLAFEKNYLEFIWLSDLEEAEQNPLQLHQRFSAKQCPFGIAYRGQLPPEMASEFWKYQPPYLAQGCIWIHLSHLQDFSLPMIFVMDLGVDNKSLWPSESDRWQPADILGGGFDSLTLKGPMQQLDFPFPQLTMLEADDYHLSIQGIDPLNLHPLPISSQQD